MANKRNLNFDCPQYVDFVAGIDGNSDDVYFDCKELLSPVGGEARKNSPAPVKVLMDEVEDRLVNKMTAALSVIENTPKLKMGVMRGKLFSERAPLKNGASQVVKPGKPDMSVQLSRMRSKSVNVRANKSNKAKEIRPKRSSSLSDLRNVKKRIHAKTPLCLQRTINSKAKPRTLKTTEEMELEQIAILRRELTQLLRNNEISYKKLIQRQKPCVQKNTETKPENYKGNAAMNTNKNERRNFLMMNHIDMKAETLKLNSIINNRGASSKAAKNVTTDILEKSNIPSVSSSIVSEDCDRIKAHSSKKPVKYGFHSGLVFYDNAKKNTVVKPFSFDVKFKERNTQKAEVSQNGKENIPVTNPKSVVKKLADKQNVKKEIKMLGSNKKIGQRYGNSVRGLTLAENSVRN